MKSRTGALFFSIALLLFFPSFLRSAQNNEDCFTCHSDPELKTATGKILYVDGEKYSLSSHGRAEISCIDCHTDLRRVTDFPHAEKLKPVSCGECHEDAASEIQMSVHGRPSLLKDAPTVRCADCHGTHEIKGKDDFDSTIFPITLPSTCEKCHLERVKTKKGSEFIRQYKKSVHFQALEKSGLTLSASCSSCHGAHNIQRVDEASSLVSRKNIIRTCGRCHVGIERDYLEGVHGKDYVKGVKDVPVCTDCHSEHDIYSPQELSSTVYSTKVAAICSRCHDDEAITRRFGLLSQRLKSYSSSFHGTASRFGETKVANCASCHGVHDIRPSSDPRSLIAPANLPDTCGRCHSGAGENFAKGKIHVVSEKESNKLGHFVKRFYLFLIAVILGTFFIFIAADLSRRLRLKWKR
jgi:predicted CXXCH cytochrome family protein